MTGKEMVSAQTLATLDILVFTVSEVCCGIDGELIGRMMMLDEAEDEKVQVRWFHQALSFGEKEVVYRKPRVVTLNGSGEETGLVIDQPRDLINLPVRSISPLPSLLEMTKGLRAFWGSFVLGEKVVLLVDPYQLLR